MLAQIRDLGVTTAKLLIWNHLIGTVDYKELSKLVQTLLLETRFYNCQAKNKLFI